MMVDTLDDPFSWRTRNAWLINGNIKEWFTQRGSRNKLRTYKLFKFEFKTEMYLTNPMPFQISKTFA